METEQDTCSMEEEDMEIDHLENTEPNQQENRNRPGKQKVRILNLKKNQYLQIKNISNQMCLQQSYFQQRKECQSQYALDKFLILMTKNFN